MTMKQLPQLKRVEGGCLFGLLLASTWFTSIVKLINVIVQKSA